MNTGARNYIENFSKLKEEVERLRILVQLKKATASEHSVIARPNDSKTTGLITSICFANNVYADTIAGLTKFDWIIDTRATYHVSYSLDLFKAYKSVLDVSIQLPTGDRLSVTHIRSIQVCPHLVLHEVLFVPSFKFNLMSVS